MGVSGARQLQTPVAGVMFHPDSLPITENEYYERSGKRISATALIPRENPNQEALADDVIVRPGEIEDLNGAEKHPLFILIPGENPILYPLPPGSVVARPLASSPGTWTPPRPRPTPPPVPWIFPPGERPPAIRIPDIKPPVDQGEIPTPLNWGPQRPVPTPGGGTEWVPIVETHRSALFGTAILSALLMVLTRGAFASVQTAGITGAAIYGGNRSEDLSL